MKKNKEKKKIKMHRIYEQNWTKEAQSSQRTNEGNGQNRN